MIGFGWFAALSTIGKVGIVSAAIATTGITATNLSRDSNGAQIQAPVCVASTSYATEKEPVAFNKSTKNDSTLDKGKRVIKTIGVDGENSKTWKITNYSPANCKPSTRVIDKEEITIAPVNEVVLIGTKEKLAPEPPVRDCDPNYTPCVPNVSYDLDCPDIGFTVRVLGSDPNNFDADGDGYGCESY